ncbi:hypothetical protein JHK86_009804 [Glycine max]|nr:hypothetical protein JHK86_009804 [Glycine max]
MAAKIGNNLDFASFFLADIEDLKEFSKIQGALEANDLTHWDITYWCETLCESKYDINEGDDTAQGTVRPRRELGSRHGARYSQGFVGYVSKNEGLSKLE